MSVKVSPERLSWGGKTHREWWRIKRRKWTANQNSPLCFLTAHELWLAASHPSHNAFAARIKWTFKSEGNQNLDVFCKQKINVFYLFVCLWGGGGEREVTWVCRSLKRALDALDWSYRQLWATKCGCWEPISLEEQQMHFTAESSFQLWACVDLCEWVCEKNYHHSKHVDKLKTWSETYIRSY